MKILVTGASGFTGKHLIGHLEKNVQNELIGIDMKADPAGRVQICDLRRKAEVVDLIGKVQPSQIYHCAGTFSNNFDIDYESNVLTTRYLLEAVLSVTRHSRVLLVGSSAEYGLVNIDDNPIKETHTLNPVSVYGLIKVYQYFLMRFYCKLHQMNIVMVRPFNLKGTGITDNLFVGKVARQIDEYKAGLINKIRMGNLGSRRDYIDISKAIADYELVMNCGTAGEVYNVGSGQSIQMRELLQSILNEHNLDISIVEENVFQSVGKIDVQDLYADLAKINQLRKQNGGRT